MDGRNTRPLDSLFIWGEVMVGAGAPLVPLHVCAVFPVGVFREILAAAETGSMVDRPSILGLGPRP